MTWQIIALSAAIAIQGILIGVCVRWRSNPAVNPLLLGLALNIFWCVLSILEILVGDFGIKSLVVRARYTLLPFIPVVWMEVVFRYVYGRRLFQGWRLAAILIFPILTFLLTWTAKFHSLVKQNFLVTFSGNLPIITFEAGLWGWLQVVFTYTLCIAAFVVLAKALRTGPPWQRRANLTLLLAVMAPFLIDAAGILGWSPTTSLSYTPITFALTGLIFTWVFFGFRLVNLSPIARTAVVDELQDMLIVVDQSGRIADLNKAARRALKTDFRSAIGAPCSELLGAWPEVLAPVETGKATSMEVRLDDEPGPATHELHVYPIDIDSVQNRSLVAQIRDIRTRKAVEAELLRAKNEAEQASSAKSWFLAMMSHEIRTPMNGVLGFLRLLKATTLDNKQMEYVDLIGQSGQSLLVIINDILDYSKIEAGSMQLENNACNLRHLLEATIRQFEPRAADKGVTLECNIPSGLPETILVDDVRLGQVLVNLIGNAVKFTESGSINVTASGETEPGPNRWRLSFAVRDTGIGITAELLPHVFQPFFQAENSISRRFGGTGLGLAISKRLCQLMEGDLTAESQMEGGSTFTATIRVKAVEVPEAGKTLGASVLRGGKSGQSLRVLVVEDNPMNRRLIEEILHRMGHLPSCVEEAQSALNLIAEQDFDAVLMDVALPGMDGMEAVRRLRAWELELGRAHLPVIALTAHTMPGDREECLASGMNDFLSKPIDPHALNQSLIRCQAPRPDPTA